MSQASTLTQSDKAAAKAFTMPVVHLGMIVLWYQDGDPHSKARPGIVTEVGPQSINLSPVRMMEERLGVRHKDDPMVKDFELAESGVWDHTQETKDIWEQITGAKMPPPPKKVPPTPPKKDEKKQE